MPDRQRERPVTLDDEIDRTGREEQVEEQVAPGKGRGAPGVKPRTGPDSDDAPSGDVDRADFPGAGAP